MPNEHNFCFALDKSLKLFHCFLFFQNQANVVLFYEGLSPHEKCITILRKLFQLLSVSVVYVYIYILQKINVV